MVLSIPILCYQDFCSYDVFVEHVESIAFVLLFDTLTIIVPFFFSKLLKSFRKPINSFL